MQVDMDSFSCNSFCCMCLFNRMEDLPHIASVVMLGALLFLLPVLYDGLLF